MARFREDSENWWWLQQLPTSLGSSERKEVNWHPTICRHLDIFLWNLMSIRFQKILPRSWEEGGSVKKSLDSSASCPRAKEEMASKSGIRQMWEFFWRQEQRQIRAGIWFARSRIGCCSAAQEKESCCHGLLAFSSGMCHQTTDKQNHFQSVYGKMCNPFKKYSHNSSTNMHGNVTSDANTI